MHKKMHKKEIILFFFCYIFYVYPLTPFVIKWNKIKYIFLCSMGSICVMWCVLEENSIEKEANIDLVVFD